MVISCHRNGFFWPPSADSRTICATSPSHIYILMTNAICSSGYSPYTLGILTVYKSAIHLHSYTFPHLNRARFRWPGAPALPATCDSNARMLMDVRTPRIHCRSDICPALPLYRAVSVRICLIAHKACIKKKTGSFLPLAPQMIRFRKWKDNRRTNKNGGTPTKTLCAIKISAANNFAPFCEMRNGTQFSGQQFCMVCVCVCERVCASWVCVM